MSSTKIDLVCDGGLPCDNPSYRKCHRHIRPATTTAHRSGYPPTPTPPSLSLTSPSWESVGVLSLLGASTWHFFLHTKPREGSARPPPVCPCCCSPTPRSHPPGMVFSAAPPCLLPGHQAIYPGRNLVPPRPADTVFVTPHFCPRASFPYDAQATCAPPSTVVRGHLSSG